MHTFKSRARPRLVDPTAAQLTLCSSAQILQTSPEGIACQKALTRYAVEGKEAWRQLWERQTDAIFAL